MGALDVQVLEQPFALRDIVGPREVLDAAARLSAFAAVENDAAVLPREMLEELGAGIYAGRGPLLHGAVEPTRGKHQQRLPCADHFVAGADAVDDDLRQG